MPIYLQLGVDETIGETAAKNDLIWKEIPHGQVLKATAAALRAGV